jgi:hypothetical protein
MKGLKMIGAALTVTVFFTACSRSRVTVYPGVCLKEQAAERQFVSRDAVEYILSEIWSSGFLCRDPRIEEEISNNLYGVFRKQRRKAAHIRGRAYFLAKNDGPDRIMLSRKIFAHYDYYKKEGPVCYLMDYRAAATMVHELFHDFWYNLMNDEIRTLFAVEAENFYSALSSARDRGERVGFLSALGWKDPAEGSFEVFEELKELRKRYPDAKFFGTELFSIIADRTFSGRMIIPLSMKNYYAGLLSDQALSSRIPVDYRARTH